MHQQPPPERPVLRSANALRVFEVAARHLGFTPAAAELCVTQVAISRMVRRLEDDIGVPLFVRTGTRLQLTEEGLLLSAAVTTGFGQMEAALREIRRRRQARPVVTLSVSTGFASHWLMPRMAGFQQVLPAIDLRLVLSQAILQGSVEQVDLGMRLDPTDRGLAQWPFCPELVLPLCSPACLAQSGPLEAPLRRGGTTLIHLTQTTMGWDDYFARAGLPAPAGARSLAFSDYAVVLQAALLGQGVALGWVSAASGAMRSRHLVPAGGPMLATGRSYRLVAPGGRSRPEVAQVVQWLQAEMQADLQALGLQPAG
ncbi:LysR family transcriptional regulator [Aquincola tertiaricarbonis]|uniref:LysR family transcriptional regulator n=1 Tax=Aquincola tertiaricarbonis TaxID=391953 RepID=UPI000614A1BC|nr:LysR family transcriptional regulator [Aquincola tertiaricarbonis]